MSFFYKILFTGLLFCSAPVSSQELWVKLNSPTQATLRNCVFTDQMNGWAAGDSGRIIHTSNGGNSFVIQNNPVDYYINDIFFLNKRLGWVISNEFSLNGTTIIKTTNGGVNWIAEDFPDTTIIFRTIYFLDSLTGYMGGFGGAISKTTDGGNTWISAFVDTSKFSGNPIEKFNFVSSELGFACGGRIDIAGVVWKTTNGGLFWTAEGLSPEPFFDMFIRDPQNIVAVGGDFEFGVQLSRTFNAGINWNYQSLKLFGQAYSIDYRTPSEAWMPLGYAENWAVTYDTGATWTTIPTVDASDIYSVDFVDSLHGWAVGADGVILKYNPQTSANSNGHFVASDFIIHQNFPNPFNPATKINYELRITNYVSLKVFDALGKEVAILVNGKKSAGKYEIEFDGNNLTSGVYYYKLTVGDLSQTKKMILIK